jgi:hypothetical protein
MDQMSKAILNLIKSYFVRPVKPQSRTIHWVKADKPLNEMTPDERKNFSESLFESMMKQAKKEDS